MKMCRTAAIAAICMCGSVFAQEQDRKFEVYGFADLNITKYWMEDNAAFRGLRYDDKLRVDLSHVNTYFDFRPNGNTRAMVELSFQGDPVANRSTAGTTVYTVSQGGAVNTVIGTLPLPAAGETKVSETQGTTLEGNSKIRALEGIVYDWGSFSIERAWMEVQFNDKANLLAGKFITPAGVWNVDHGSPVILTVKQPFQTGLVSIFPKSQIGIMERGRGYIGDVDLDYSAYLSTGRIHNTDETRNSLLIETPKDLAVGGNLSVNFPVASGLKIGASGFSGMQKQEYRQRIVKVDITKPATDAANEAAGLVATGKLDPTGIASYIQTKVGEYVATQALNPDNHSYDDVMKAQARENVFGVDAVLDVKKFSLQTEFNQQRIKNQLKNDSLTKTTGFYGLASYKIPMGENARLTPYVMYERVMQEGADNNAGTFMSGSNTGTPGSVLEGFQTYVGGVNLRLFTNFIIKAEYSYADVLTQGIYKDHETVFDAGALNIQFSMAF